MAGPDNIVDVRFQEASGSTRKVGVYGIIKGTGASRINKADLGLKTISHIIGWAPGDVYTTTPKFTENEDSAGVEEQGSVHVENGTQNDTFYLTVCGR